MNNPATKQKTYFKGLNGIRAIAAVGVLIGHTIFAINICPLNQFPRYAVIVFFTLSGFLITYLLEAEKAKTGTINFKHFYVRRILRIWPLYFFYILCVFFVHLFIIGDGVANTKYLGFFIVFSQNVLIYFNRAPTDMGHLWSIGVEEQFYLFWPFVLLFVRKPKRFLYSLILIILFIRGLLKVYGLRTGNLSLFYFSESFRFDCMAIGALAAIYFRQRNKYFISLCKSFATPIVFWVFIVLTALYRFNFFSIYTDNVVSIITALFIVNQITTIRFQSILEDQVMNFLGRISYGIYMYHPIAISLFLFYSRLYHVSYSPVLMVILVLIATIFFAFLSFHLLERPFLKLKKSYT